MNPTSFKRFKHKGWSGVRVLSVKVTDTATSAKLLLLQVAKELMQIKGIALARARAGRWPALRYEKSRVRLRNSFAVSCQICGSAEPEDLKFQPL